MPEPTFQEMVSPKINNLVKWLEEAKMIYEGNSICCPDEVMVDLIDALTRVMIKIRDDEVTCYMFSEMLYTDYYNRVTQQVDMHKMETEKTKKIQQARNMLKFLGTQEQMDQLEALDRVKEVKIPGYIQNRIKLYYELLCSYFEIYYC
jgi:hypothetical protein